MKKIILSGVILTGLIIGCRQMPEQPDNSYVEPQLPAAPYDYAHINSPYGKINVLYEDSTPINNMKATIGRVLFYDKALSYNNSTACASCHHQDKGFADGNQLSVGFKGMLTKRNSMSISNLFTYRNTGYFWDSREAEIEEMVFRPVQDHIEMGFENIVLITEKVNNLPYYKKLFKDCYGDEQITQERLRESLGHFLFSIVNTNSKFDIGLKTNFSNFTDEEKDGMKLYTDNGCQNCHFLHAEFSPVGFAREKMGNIGLDLVDQDPGMNHLFRIPDLRNVVLTSPYMHDGRFTTINQVLTHYGTSIQENPFLSKELNEHKPKFPVAYYSGVNVNNLVKFLMTLNDEYTLKDARFSDPFAH